MLATFFCYARCQARMMECFERSCRHMYFGERRAASRAAQLVAEFEQVGHGIDFHHHVRVRRVSTRMLVGTFVAGSTFERRSIYSWLMCDFD